MAFQSSKYEHVVSIDFGTTFSGSCFATNKKELHKGDIKTVELNKLEKIKKLIDTLKERAKNTEIEVAAMDKYSKKDKAPTLVIYDQSRQLKSWGLEAKLKIKLQALEPTDTIMKEFKLRLPRTIAQKGASQKPGSVEENEEDSNLRALIDYLKVVYTHVHQSLSNSLAVQEEKRPVDRESIRFVLTVPAIWNDNQRAVMRQAATVAGLIHENDHEKRLIIINESLAATLFAERDMESGEFLEEDDIYIVCDAGGGTIDIASFIKTKEHQENISFGRCQLTADSGGECGSTFIDKNMRELLSYVLYGEDIFKGIEEGLEMDKQMKNNIATVEKLVEEFADEHTTNNVIINGKHLFGQKMNDEEQLQDDQYYFDLDSNSPEFSDIHSRATRFMYFPIRKSQLIDDLNHKFTKPSEFKLSKEYEVEELYVNKDGIYFCNNSRKLVIPFKIMVERVFAPIVSKILVLLERQIKKVGGKVKAIFLVGGLGRNHYLERRIKLEFSGYVDEVHRNKKADIAAMKGAAFYGVDDMKRDLQTDIVGFDYKDDKFDPEYYDTVICIDIGYDHTSCSYVNLAYKDGKQVEEIVEVNEWPGPGHASAVQIPTAYQKQDGRWGAQVLETTNVSQGELIVPSRHMSNVKDDLRQFLVDFLKNVKGHVFKKIEDNENKTDPSKFRYCITMENSYRFFYNKSSMRNICIEAGLVEENSDVRRLLLFKREDAAAMYLENTKLQQSYYSTYYLQIFFRHDSCHLALHESVKICGLALDKSKIENDTENKSNYFRNVRGIRSATIDFNFVGKLIHNLDLFVAKDSLFCCNAVGSDNGHSSYYRSDLRKSFLQCVEDELDFSSDKHGLEIKVRDNCCVISVSVYDLLEHVFRPAIQDLVFEINRHIIQTGINNFRMDKIFLMDKLFKAKQNTYEFLEKMFAKALSDAINIEDKQIELSEPINVAALQGALLYGTVPWRYTERVARKTYMVTVTAFNFKPFEKETLDELIKIDSEYREDDKDKQYDLEARAAYKYGDERLDVFYQSSINPSKTYKIGPSYQNLFIRRGTKITEKDQTHGIVQKFYCKKECLVHATIYVSEKNDLEFPLPSAKGSATIDSDIPDHFQKIHQFEIYIKTDPEDPWAKASTSFRHYFDIRLIPDNNEIKFEASNGTRIGKKIPEFRFRDEILVATIYGDETEIKLPPTSFSPEDIEKKIAEEHSRSKEQQIKDIAVGSSN